MRGPHVIFGIGLFLNIIPLAKAPALDLNNIDQLKKAASAAMSNLMSYYSPSYRGAFDTDITPWQDSLMIWSLHFDYASDVGDTRYLATVQNALYRQSNNQSHSFLVKNVVEQWNGGILWGAEVPVAAAEFLGPQAKLPKSSATWIGLAQKTLQQVAPQTDNGCGGGLFWYRNREDPKHGRYKAFNTNTEFISAAARSFLITKDTKVLGFAQQLVDWLIGPSRLADVKTGILQDGVDAKDASCQLSTDQWTYNYGLWLGSMAWLFKATGDQKYLTMASTVFTHSVKIFAPKGIIAEICEPTSCSRDSKGFKAVYIRNLVYLHRVTTDQAMKTAIQNLIDTSVKAMAQTSCDAKFNCAAAWAAGSPPEKNVRSQHVSTALLVAAIGIRKPPANAARAT
ncbi:hydrolase 76 protein [Puccinia graminis f. sp. tritici]|uniref:mannan endo-1,6-alpha-mannosidase n=1 Tax=Puccinia graminis f. sp. tritici TaxID=56615 RepID=A0A5B0QBV1_PUCGR|nr:hydrolase 76 protein [Puccinia graminis f. sp. tritici]KAA1134845.1 hydrolase 76 protein [Puccinia graminis f. sp. tritici]